MRPPFGHIDWGAAVADRSPRRANAPDEGRRPRRSGVHSADAARPCPGARGTRRSRPADIQRHDEVAAISAAAPRKRTTEARVVAQAHIARVPGLVDDVVEGPL